MELFNNFNDLFQNNSLIKSFNSKIVLSYYFSLTGNSKLYDSSG